VRTDASLVKRLFERQLMTGSRVGYLHGDTHPLDKGQIPARSAMSCASATRSFTVW
jgi:hypothetical protein